MAKRKPDQSINLRIELQDYERKALAQAQTASAIKDVAEAIDKLTSFENFYLLVTVAEIVTGKEIIPGTPNDIYKLIDWVREYLKTEDTSNLAALIPGVDADTPGGLLWDLFTLTPFGVPFRVGEYVAEEVFD